MSGAFCHTREQLELIETTESIYVEACPGAGKTRSIIERFTRRPGAEPRRGVALISFTNAVVDAARSGCAGRPELTRSPNFVGTIDSFINHFFVGPLLTSNRGYAITFRSSWSQVPGAHVTANRGSARMSASLDWFRFDLDGTATLDAGRATPDRRRALRILSPADVGALQRAAKEKWRNLVISRGILDSAASRTVLRHYLTDETKRELLGDLTSGRFYEVIVDEVQDCSSEDAALLDLLIDVGIRVVLVGDPQQAIYGFRGGAAADLVDTLKRVPRGSRLDGNFRSSTAIVAVVDSLRSSPDKDVAVGLHKDAAHPVHLVRYTRPAEARFHIRTILEDAGIATRDVVVLAHAAAKASDCAGAGSTASSFTTNKLALLARHVHLLQGENTDPRRHSQALTALGDLLQTTVQTAADDSPSLPSYLEEHKLSSREYRELCLRLAMDLPGPYASSPSQFRAHLVAWVNTHPSAGWRTAGLRTPTRDRWSNRPAEIENCEPHSTVHGYKGLQSPAVALILPPPSADTPADEDGLTQWTNDVAGESRNVLYVGASRAEQLLMLVAHQAVFEAVRAALDRDRVAYRADD